MEIDGDYWKLVGIDGDIFHMYSNNYGDSFLWSLMEING